MTPFGDINRRPHAFSAVFLNALRRSPSKTGTAGLSSFGGPVSAAMQGAFRALADPTRRQILVHLNQQELTIGEVANRFEMTRGAIKKHLDILERGQLISVRSRGRERVNRFEPGALAPVSEWLGYFSRAWDERLANLAKAIENHAEPKQ